MRHLVLLASVALSPVTLSPVALLAQGKPIRVLVYHDMEGLAGQDDPFTYRFDHPQQYAKGRQFLVADLSAVIAGLFDGGATEVNVIDAHGSGNPEPDVPEGSLDPRVKQIFRDKPFRGYVDLVEPNRYDAVVARAGPIDLAAFLTALATAIARGWLEFVTGTGAASSGRTPEL